MNKGIGKPKKPRVKRPAAEIAGQLQEQLGFLVSSCELFDGGNPAEAKRLALALRILLHQGRAPSLPLLGQVPGFNWNKFHSMMIPYVPENALDYHGLIMTRVSSTGDTGDVRYLPTLDDLHWTLKARKFLDWWFRDIVFKDKDGEIFTRKDLVLAIANTDGGGHVDPELGQVYIKLSRENSLGWLFHAGSREWFENPVPPAIRQIAHEMLRTLEAQGFHTGYAPVDHSKLPGVDPSLAQML